MRPRVLFQVFGKSSWEIRSYHVTFIVEYDNKSDITVEAKESNMMNEFQNVFSLQIVIVKAVFLGPKIMQIWFL